METTDIILNLIHCRTCNRDLPKASFVKNGKLLKMCADCRVKRTGPRQKKDKAAPVINGAVNPEPSEPALIALDVCQAEQVLSAILGGQVSLDGDRVMVDAEALARRFPNSADLLPLLIKE